MKSEIRKFMDNVNYVDLKKQKAALLNAICRTKDPKEEELLTGLLNFIDSFQDLAVDTFIKDENMVFNFSEN